MKSSCSVSRKVASMHHSRTTAFFLVKRDWQRSGSNLDTAIRRHIFTDCTLSSYNPNWSSAILQSVRLVILFRYSSSKNRLCSADHVMREYEIDHIILILQAGASGEVLRSSIADALWHRRAGVREHLDCRTPIPPKLFEESETLLHSGFVLYLVQENAEYCAVFNSLSAPLGLDCSPTSEPIPTRSWWNL